MTTAQASRDPDVDVGVKEMPHSTSGIDVNTALQPLPAISYPHSMSPNVGFDINMPPTVPKLPQSSHSAHKSVPPTSAYPYLPESMDFPSVFAQTLDQSTSMFDNSDYSQFNLSFDSSDQNLDLDLLALFSENTNFTPDFLEAFGTNSNSGFADHILTDTLFQTPTLANTGDLESGSIGSFSVDELPRLPLPPPSSPFDSAEGSSDEPGNPIPRLLAIKDIDLELSEKNILHSKRACTMSSHAADAAAAPVSKKPRSRRT
ncbi:hypothetical protein MSAN_01069600 [Mycena sanguinolenta]|uniref:Uncharacterized protein n=1 Tax=Mycena sanguinolenta TaxID=230812 RepID=A0A8H7D9Y0_9AGAR|nr:hypothetical protein MSAN_01069600 [Mycena sanguinolenta]